mmetsp:Transcript_102271/g.288939  ORF Transcript_102271/g.288939 Transcript_102271/m.288939 type:complete len:458 (-) Transcript_102271:220-1593(-)
MPQLCPPPSSAVSLRAVLRPSLLAALVLFVVPARAMHGALLAASEGGGAVGDAVESREECAGLNCNRGRCKLANMRKRSRRYRCCCEEAKQAPPPSEALLGTSSAGRLPGQFADWQSWSELIRVRNMNFIFCALPKNACTLWKQMLLRASGSGHWNTENSKLIHDPVKSGLDLVGLKRGGHTRDSASRNVSDIVDVFEAKDRIVKAVIVRDPVTRLLSSYLDRCVDMHEWHRCSASSPISLDETVRRLETRRAHGDIQDVHFRAQMDMCGLRYLHYDLVGHMENFAEDSHAILEFAHLWDDFGKEGWGRNGKSAFGVQAQLTSNHKQEHKTEELVCKHYTPETLARVHKLYKTDFEAFGYDVAHWESTCAAAWANRTARVGDARSRLRVRITKMMKPRHLTLFELKRREELVQRFRRRRFSIAKSAALRRRGGRAIVAALVVSAAALPWAVLRHFGA